MITNECGKLKGLNLRLSCYQSFFNSCELLSLLSALCAWHAKAREALAVPAAYFIPRPKVDSSFMVLDMRERPPVPEADAGLTMRVARAAFAMRRKTMLNNLQPAFGLTREQAQACLEAAGIEPAARGETLSVQAFADIAQALAQIKKI